MWNWKWFQNFFFFTLTGRGRHYGQLIQKQKWRSGVGRCSLMNYYNFSSILHSNNLMHAFNWFNVSHNQLKLIYFSSDSVTQCRWPFENSGVNIRIFKKYFWNFSGDLLEESQSEASRLRQRVEELVRDNEALKSSSFAASLCMGGPVHTDTQSKCHRIHVSGEFHFARPNFQFVNWNLLR